MHDPHFKCSLATCDQWLLHWRTGELIGFKFLSMTNCNWMDLVCPDTLNPSLPFWDAPTNPANFYEADCSCCITSFNCHNSCMTHKAGIFERFTYKYSFLTEKNRLRNMSASSKLKTRSLGSNISMEFPIRYTDLFPHHSHAEVRHRASCEWKIIWSMSRTEEAVLYALNTRWQGGTRLCGV